MCNECAPHARVFLETSASHVEARVCRLCREEGGASPSLDIDNGSATIGPPPAPYPRPLSSLFKSSTGVEEGTTQPPTLPLRPIARTPTELSIALEAAALQSSAASTETVGGGGRTFKGGSMHEAETYNTVGASRANAPKSHIRDVFVDSTNAEWKWGDKRVLSGDLTSHMLGAGASTGALTSLTRSVRAPTHGSDHSRESISGGLAGSSPSRPEAFAVRRDERGLSEASSGGGGGSGATAGGGRPPPLIFRRPGQATSLPLPPGERVEWSIEGFGSGGATPRTPTGGPHSSVSTGLPPPVPIPSPIHRDRSGGAVHGLHPQPSVYSRTSRACLSDGLSEYGYAYISSASGATALHAGAGALTRGGRSSPPPPLDFRQLQPLTFAALPVMDGEASSGTSTERDKQSAVGEGWRAWAASSQAGARGRATAWSRPPGASSAADCGAGPAVKSCLNCRQMFTHAGAPLEAGQRGSDFLLTELAASSCAGDCLASYCLRTGQAL